MRLATRSIQTTPVTVQDFALRSLDLLALIDRPIMSLGANTQLVGAHVDATRDMSAMLRQNGADRILDPEGKVCELLSKASAAAASMRTRAEQHRAGLSTDPVIEDDDGVVDAFDAYIAMLADAEDAIAEALDLIETLDAMKSPTLPGEFTSVDALADAMRG